MSSNGFKALTAAEIDQLEDLVIEKHPVPEWGEGVGVYVRSISAAERGQVDADAAMFRESGGKNISFAKTFTVKMAWLGICDERGERLYKTAGDLERLQKRNAAAIAGIAVHIQRLSGYTKEDIETLEKNLDDPRLSDSVTD